MTNSSVAQNQYRALLQLRDFLNGSAELDGVWFGERHPKERGLFWWRKHMRAVIDEIAAAPRMAAMLESLLADNVRLTEEVERWKVVNAENVDIEAGLHRHIREQDERIAALVLRLRLELGEEDTLEKNART